MTTAAAAVLATTSLIGAIDDTQFQKDKAVIEQRDIASRFVTTEGAPTEALRELLELDGLYEQGDTLAKIVEKTQKVWIATVQGKGNRERTDIKNSSSQEVIREKIEAIARDKLRLFDERPPALKQYRYYACLGAFLDGIRMRLKEAVDQWKKGTHFEEMVCFSGERDLRKDKEDALSKLTDPAQSPLPFKEGWTLPEGAKYDTEYDLMKLIVQQVQFPKDMEVALEGHTVLVNAPRGSNPRPSTKDCYEHWKKEEKPQPGTMLAISHPLIWSYQQLAGQNALGKDFPLDTIAPALSEKDREAKKDSLVGLVHDTVAKCLYEIHKGRLAAEAAAKKE